MVKGVVIVVLLSLIIVFFLVKKAIRLYIKSKLYRPIKKVLKLRNVEYRDLYININNGKYHRQHNINPSKEYINVWYLKKFKNSKIVLYFHGNSYNMSYRKYMIDICNIMQLNLLLVDYRGYGNSQGDATAQNILKDADVSYNFLIQSGYSPSDIIVWGESLGGSPACYVASKYKIYALVILSTFASLHTLMQDVNNAVRNSAYWAIRLITEDLNHYTNNVEMIKRATCPVLIFHSEEDTLIPYSNAVELIDSVTSNNKILVKISGDHDSPKITLNNFKKVISILKLNYITNEDLVKVVDIIDNLSFTAKQSSSATQ